MHYTIVIAIIALIVIIQIRFFVNTQQKISDFLSIFPDQGDEYKLSREILVEKINSVEDRELDIMLTMSGLDSGKYRSSRLSSEFGEPIPVFQRKKAQKDLIAALGNETGISVNHDNPALITIISSINDYLKNNKSVSDFHLIKDIVDRNCDAKEDEINTQIPIPLYMGLVGTMAGILVGILYLWLSGGIGDLLNAGGGSGADGVEALLGGVALAMISSILGIVLTTWGSNSFKTAKSVVESDKHAFLSWIQAKLLPTLSDNIVGAIREMTGNLNEFNETFSSNICNLDDALGKVNESYRLQTQLLDAVKKVADKDISLQNLQLYNTLKSSTQEISTLAEYLNNTNEYLTNVRALNEKLDLQENRTRCIEETGSFFKTEIKEIEQRKQAIGMAVGKVDDYLKQALEKLKENADNQFSELQKSTIKQQDLLQNKTEEIGIIIDELKNLAAVKESFSKFEQAMCLQNNKLENLVNAIQSIPSAKAESINIPVTSSSRIPVWQRGLIWTGSVVGGLVILALLIANWDNIYSGLVNILRF